MHVCVRDASTNRPDERGKVAWRDALTRGADDVTRDDRAGHDTRRGSRTRGFAATTAEERREGTEQN